MDKYINTISPERLCMSEEEKKIDTENKHC